MLAVNSVVMQVKHVCDAERKVGAHTQVSYVVASVPAGAGQSCQARMKSNRVNHGGQITRLNAERFRHWTPGARVERAIDLQHKRFAKVYNQLHMLLE